MTIFSAIAAVATTGFALISFILVNLGVARNATETAADQAALAAAGRVIASHDLACEVAEKVARAHLTELLSCEIDGSNVWVSVRRPSPAALESLFARLGVESTGFVALSHAEQPFSPVW